MSTADYNDGSAWNSKQNNSKFKILFSDQDDWETDANADTGLTEQEQRWGKNVGQTRNAAIE